MPLTPGQTKALLRERGWLMLDLAARWKISPAWASKLINHPELRNAIHEDAFAGLPHRGQVEVQRQARHMRKPRPKGWTLAQMFPVGRVFEALDSALMDEGTRMAVQGVHLGPPAAVIFAGNAKMQTWPTIAVTGTVFFVWIVFAKDQTLGRFVRRQHP